MNSFSLEEGIGSDGMMSICGGAWSWTACFYHPWQSLSENMTQVTFSKLSLEFFCWYALRGCGIDREAANNTVLHVAQINIGSSLQPSQIYFYYLFIYFLCVCMRACMCFRRFPKKKEMCFARFPGKPYNYMPYDVREQDAHGGAGRPGTPYRLSPRDPSKASPQPDPARYSVPPGKQATSALI